jgi:anti-anti-sigma regulatory factor
LTEIYQGVLISIQILMIRSRYFVVVAMALIGLLQGSGLMMVVGLLFAFVITLWRMRNTSIVHSSGSLNRYRSATNRPAKDVKLIESQHERTQVIVLARTGLSFHNVAALADATEQLIEDATTHVRHCIIDFAAVTSVSFDSCQTFTEILELALNHDFQLIFTGLQDHVADALIRAGVPIMFGVLRVPLARQLDEDGPGCVLCPILLDESGETTGCAELDAALVVCEDDLLNDPTAIVSSPKVQRSRSLPTDASRNQDQESSRQCVVSAFPELNTHAATPVLVDLFNWSHGYFPEGTFELAMLRVLSQFLQVRDFSIGEHIYISDWELPRESTGAPNAQNTPPLVWLLRGAIEHKWSIAESEKKFGLAPRQIAGNYNLSEGAPFEHAEVDVDSEGSYAVGPLATHNAFFGCMPHCGDIVAVAGSRTATASGSVSCALLTREAYDRMRRDHPDVANLMIAHCARKRWTNTAKSINDGCPMLVL